ncbi:hypothetical protein BDQ17DRAFT_1435815 [Cyathus striatus]|nr:hypothetical protein BDQ17DRAFT_1435815 [Cyathus striatus]
MVQLNIIAASTLLLFPLLSTALPRHAGNVDVGQQIVVRVLEELYGREFLLELRDLHEVLDARSWAGFKNGIKKVAHTIKKVATGPVGKAAANAGLNILSQGGSFYGRDIEDLNEINAREFDGSLYERDWVELDERSWNGFKNGVKNGAKRVANSIKKVATGPVGKAAAQTGLNILATGVVSTDVNLTVQTSFMFAI